MTEWATDFMGRDTDELFPRTLGEEVAAMVRRRWPRDTAKQVAKAWDLDPKTAKNVIEGHASERTLTKALKAEGWGLLETLGHALTGQTYEEWQEERVNHLIGVAERAKQNVERLRAHRERLEEIACHLDGDPDRLDALPRRRARG
jgi:hypothetical protein